MPHHASFSLGMPMLKFMVLDRRIRWEKDFKIKQNNKSLEIIHWFKSKVVRL